jgi:hypothetical protein
MMTRELLMQEPKQPAKFDHAPALWWFLHQHLEWQKLVLVAMGKPETRTMLLAQIAKTEEAKEIALQLVWKQEIAIGI